MIKSDDKYIMPFFAGISAFLSVSESLIPTPFPFLKLGISNIPVCIGFSIFSFSQIIFIIFFKVIITNIVRGSLFSFPMLISLCGNLLFILFTMPVYKLLKSKISFISVSIIGAFSHNIGQLAASIFFIPLQTLTFIAIIIIPAGLISGFITGLICNNIYNNHMERLLEALRKIQ